MSVVKCKLPTAAHTHTHTLTDTQRFNQLCTTGGALAACKHTHIYNCYVCTYVCAQGKEKTKQNTSERQTITIACARTSWLRRLCCYCAVDVLLLRCSCCWPCQQVGSARFWLWQSHQLSAFTLCLPFVFSLTRKPQGAAAKVNASACVRVCVCVPPNVNCSLIANKTDSPSIVLKSMSSIWRPHTNRRSALRCSSTGS